MRRGILGTNGRVRRPLALGAANAALPFVLIAFAEVHITASLASILNAGHPLFAGLVGRFGFGERPMVGQRAGLVVGAVSVGVLVGLSPLPLGVQRLLQPSNSRTSREDGFQGRALNRHVNKTKPLPNLKKKG